MKGQAADFQLEERKTTDCSLVDSSCNSYGVNGGEITESEIGLT